MYLKKLELSGFKSFANKTVIDFSPSFVGKNNLSSGKNDKNKLGITAIVGPNGSGKSNIADAIRWVMGEQSMKNLRGKKSEDIIFAGSVSKGKLSYATASLHFDNSDKGIPLDFSEVIITRKIYRSGESEYLINGSRVRLIDVADILAKAGVGKDSYSVVNQGMSDAVLNATPVERRSILEDAAGVKQYQIKKIRAIKKLETTRKNLEQVGSLLNEIEPHLRSLSGQARKAERGKVIKKELQELQESYFSYLWDSFQKEREAFVGEKDSCGRDMMNVQREVDKLNDFVQVESKKMQENKKPDELKVERDKIYGQISNLERELIVSEGKREVLEERLGQQSVVRSILVDKAYIKNGLESIYFQQKELSKKLSLVKKIEEVEEVKISNKKISKSIFELRDNVAAGKVEGKMTKDQLEKIKEIKKELGNIKEDKLEKKQEIDKLRESIHKINKGIEDEVRKDRKAREEFFRAEEQLRSSQRKLSNLKDKFNESKVAIARIEVREEDLVSEAKSSIGKDIKKLSYDGTEFDKHETEAKISKMKVQVEQSGGIDPLVVDEYNETKDRYDTLEKESEDLEKAIVSLRAVAKDMDVEIEKVFAKAFLKINEEFSKYFKIIFGGGKASLTKIKTVKRKIVKKDENILSEEGLENDPYKDPDESEEDSEQETEIGIDIAATPPGKKIADLSMLSGGERSLTSLALLFAIISYNPPPFAVLDEVEAALDEANSRRFGKILSKLSSNTQFVAITHNRETMCHASYLYGATMGDDGITKLVSVKIDDKLK